MASTEMIYIVDEDIANLRAYVCELEFRELKVKQLQHADAGFKKLTSMTESWEFAVIDVMLGTAANGSGFTRADTEDFVTTGLSLIEKIRAKMGDETLKKIVIFSMASSQDVVQKITAFADKTGIKYLRKSEYSNPADFGDFIEGQLKALRAST
jgi:ActR/RegA family two-component response regulator